MDIVHALSPKMLPFVFVFLFMLTFDAIGTLIGVSEQAGFMRDNKLPRARQAMVSDAIGTVAGAALGTSTVTSFIESASGVEQGGRTGLTGLVVAALFLLALFFSPLIAMVGSYPPITAPALVIVGAMMIQNVARLTGRITRNPFPPFLTLIGIPLSYSIADGLALGFISYPIIKFLQRARTRRRTGLPMCSPQSCCYILFLCEAEWVSFLKRMVMRNIPQKLSIARGEQPAELLFKNARLVNVLSGEIHPANVAVEDGRVVGIGDYKARKTIDLQGAYLAPSLIDGHFHVESSMLTAPEFARAVVPHGTGAVVIDPHEYANVLGLDGIRYVLESSKNLAARFFHHAAELRSRHAPGNRRRAHHRRRFEIDDRRRTRRGCGRTDEFSRRLSRRKKRAGEN